MGVALFFAAVFLGAAFLAGAGALRFLVTRPVLVLPKTFSVSVTAGAWRQQSVSLLFIIGRERLTGAGALALRLLAVLAVALVFVAVFLGPGVFFGAPALVTFFGAPTFFLGAASLGAASFLVADFYAVGQCT